MSVYSTYKGEICFKTEEAAEEVRQRLLKDGWIFRRDGGGYVWADETGDPFWENDVVIPETGKCIILPDVVMRNIHRQVEWMLAHPDLDEENTYFRSTCYDGMFLASEFRSGADRSLSDEEIAEIIGFHPSKIDYSEGHEYEPNGFATAEMTLDRWLDDI
jgi:hypothetical protein